MNGLFYYSGSSALTEMKNSNQNWIAKGKVKSRMIFFTQMLISTRPKLSKMLGSRSVSDFKGVQIYRTFANILPFKQFWSQNMKLEMLHNLKLYKYIVFQMA